MQRINWRRIFIAAALVTLPIVYVLLWLRMISSPAERTGADFVAFYTSGRIAQSHGAAKVYEPALQQAVQQELVGFPLAPGQVLLYNHVPYLIPITAILVSENYVASFYRWLGLLLALSIAGVVLLTGLFRRDAWGRREIWLAAAGMLTFFPLFVSLLNGQDTAFILLGLSIFLFGMLTGKDWLAGLGLALTTVRPHVTVLLAVPFLFRRQKVLGWFCAGAALLGLLSLAIMGLDGMRGFLQVLLVTAGGEWYGMKEPFMVNLVGLLWRVAPGLGGAIIRGIGWTVYGLTLAGLCVLWAHSREITEKQIGLAVTLTLFSVPHLHYHDLALLLIPIAALVLYLVRGGSLEIKKAALAPLGISVAFLFSNFAPILKYNFPYLTMLILVLALWLPGTQAGKNIFGRWKLSETTRQADP